MEAIIVGVNRIDQTRHTATVSHDQLRAMVAEMVAKASGLSLAAANVTVDQVLFVYRDTNPGREVTVQCTLIEDHARAQPVSRATGGHAID